MKKSEVGKMVECRVRASLDLSPRWLPRLLAVAAFALLVIHVTLQTLHYKAGGVHWLLKDAFDVDEEQNIPTWFSAMLLLISALLLFSIARVKREERAAGAGYWKALAIGFVWLSLDEVAGIHEILNTLDFDEAPTVSDVPAYKLEAVAPVRVEPQVEIEESAPETIPFADRPAEAEVPRPGAPAPAVEAVSEEIASVTLAELYYDQGFPEKALEVYRMLLARDPGHERARARVAEIEALARGPALETPAEPAVSEPIPGADARVARRATIERTIARLEAMLSATRKE